MNAGSLDVETVRRLLWPERRRSVAAPDRSHWRGTVDGIPVVLYDDRELRKSDIEWVVRRARAASERRRIQREAGLS